MKDGTRPRVLLSQKRSNVLKARAVKRGDLENVLQTGGYYFCYNASVASLKTTRLILSLPRGGDGGDELVLAVIHVSYAFLQSNPYGGGKVKYTPWKDALTGVMRAFRASGPQYGGGSAPTRWLDTLIEFMASIGFESCYNEPPVFIDRKAGVIVAVDDATVYGKKIHVVAFLVALKARFVCKEVEYLTKETTIDLLGVELSMAGLLGGLYTIVSMESYTRTVLLSLGV